VNGTLREVMTDLQVQVAVLTVEIRELKVSVVELENKVDICKQVGRIDALETKVQPLHDAAIEWRGSKKMLILICSATGGTVAWALARVAGALGF
jgi:hypothetical protein